MHDVLYAAGLIVFHIRDEHEEISVCVSLFFLGFSGHLCHSEEKQIQSKVETNNLKKPVSVCHLLFFLFFHHAHSLFPQFFAFYSQYIWLSLWML